MKMPSVLTTFALDLLVTHNKLAMYNGIGTARLLGFATAPTASKQQGYTKGRRIAEAAHEKNAIKTPDNFLVTVG
jgi:hypothetical protein